MATFQVLFGQPNAVHESSSFAMNHGREVLQRILSAAELDHGAFATALGLSKQVLSEMLAGQRDIPLSLYPLIAAVMGVKESVLKASPRDLRNSDVVPAIWYKMRGPGLSEVDREYVLSIRQLAFYQHELEAVTGIQPVRWRVLFEDLRRQRDLQASPTEQGRQAARMFRVYSGLDVGATGIGEVFRGNLRSLGLLVIESAAPQSVFEGCSFYVGPAESLRPCLFANSYRTTWFRRNQILMHELAHAIFDVDDESAVIDLNTQSHTSEDDVRERRADAFAQEALVPSEVLRHQGQRLGVDWKSDDPQAFVPLIAATHTEQRLLAKALLDSQLITDAQAEALSNANIGERLRELSTHALGTREFLQSQGGKEAIGTKHRTTTTTPKKLLLPPRYVGSVLDARGKGTISDGKAARMLMIDEYDLEERFPIERMAHAA